MATAKTFAITLNSARCSGCGRCIAACAPALFHFETQAWRKRAVLTDAAVCSGCALCVRRCPTAALSLRCTPGAAPAQD